MDNSYKQRYWTVVGLILGYIIFSNPNPIQVGVGMKRVLLVKVDSTTILIIPEEMKDISTNPHLPTKLIGFTYKDTIYISFPPHDDDNRPDSARSTSNHFIIKSTSVRDDIKHLGKMYKTDGIENRTDTKSPISNNTSVSSPKCGIDLKDGRIVVDLQPVSSRQAVIVDHELLKLLISRLPSARFDEMKRQFAEKVEECQTIAEYRELLAEEFVFHSTIELVNTTDVNAIVREQGEIKISTDRIMEHV